ncbi:hypothetical protein H9636_16990 [Ureibacillus sp. Re31]|uniref:Uncharacterized protein n=1 Tax=Ureibacillus galli TaxID=2762222 RepID=A0ABR8XGK6_9BACL|nr:hypothetical protein [Ureibacillus galli]MBD8028341.1 hypothetical protein [Ureibacillus galli]
MKKKLLFLSMAFLLTLGISLNVTTNAEASSTSIEDEKEVYKEELSNLNQEEINESFKRIDQEYAIGEEFSLKDQVFIEMYAKPVIPGGMTIFKQKYVSGSGSANGVTVKVSGYIKDDVQNIINQSFGAQDLKTSTTAGSSKVKSVKTVVHHTAYGLVGSGGVGKVYSGSISTSGKNTTLNSTKRYSAIVAYASTWCTVTVNHTGGTFTINPD